MRTPAEYRLQAQEYVSEAHTITEERRIHLLEMAESCLRLAEQAEQFEAQMRSRTAARL
jgi:hypothetical protein